MSGHKLPNQDYARVIFTVMKDEGPFILEWIAYHLSIGFTHFVVLTNDCSDGTDKILRQLEKLGIVTHKNNPSPHPKGPQKTGYGRMRNLEAFQKAEWLMTLDCDEFLRIDVGDGHLDTLFKYIGADTHAVSFIWQLFGNNGVAHNQNDLIISQFTKASHPLQARPYEIRSFKTLYKGGYFAKLGTHRPNTFIGSETAPFRWLDADGHDITPLKTHRLWNAQENGLAFGTYLGRINHYALRSIDSFAIKWMRGFVHPTAPTVRGKGTPIDYWRLFNWAEVDNFAIQRWVNSTYEMQEAIRDQLNLKNLTKKAHDWHIDRAARLREANPQLFAQLRALSPSQVNEELPDFSTHGCPPIGKQEYINPLAQQARAESSIFAEKLLEHLNQLEVPSETS